LSVGNVDGNIVIEPPVGLVKYNCQTKKGFMIVNWESLFGYLQLVRLNFDLSTRERKNNYQWSINSTKIQRISEKISQNNYALGALGRAVSVFYDNAMYTSTIR